MARCDAMPRPLNVVLLTETRYSGQACLEMDEGHTLCKYGAINNQRTSGCVGFLVFTDHDLAPSVIRLVDHPAWVYVQLMHLGVFPIW